MLRERRDHANSQTWQYRSKALVHRQNPSKNTNHSVCYDIKRCVRISIRDSGSLQMTPNVVHNCDHQSNNVSYRDRNSSNWRSWNDSCCWRRTIKRERGRPDGLASLNGRLFCTIGREYQDIWAPLSRLPGAVRSLSTQAPDFQVPSSQTSNWTQKSDHRFCN